SGAAPFGEVLTAAIKVAELTEYCAPPGAMLAILDSIAIVDRHVSEFRDCEVTARNFERSFVVSGRRSALARLQGFLKSIGVNTAELPVDFSFHSPDMNCLLDPCRLVLNQVNFRPPRIPIISTALRGFLKEVSWQSLEAATRSQLDLMETIRWLESTG